MSKAFVMTLRLSFFKSSQGEDGNVNAFRFEKEQLILFEINNAIFLHYVLIKAVFFVFKNGKEQS